MFKLKWKFTWLQSVYLSKFCTVQSLRSSIPAPPANFKLRDDHLSGSSLKGEYNKYPRVLIEFCWKHCGVLSFLQRAFVSGHNFAVGHQCDKIMSSTDFFRYIDNIVRLCWILQHLVRFSHCQTSEVREASPSLDDNRESWQASHFRIGYKVQVHM